MGERGVTPHEHLLIDFATRLDALELALTIAIKGMQPAQIAEFIRGYRQAVAGWEAGSLYSPVPELYLQQLALHTSALLRGIEGAQEPPPRA